MAPDALALVPEVTEDVAQMHEALQHDPFRHAHRQAAVDKADDRNVGQTGDIQHGIDTGAAEKDHFEVGRALKEIGIRLPQKGIVNVAQIRAFVGGIGEIDAASIDESGFKDFGDGLRRELEIDENGAFGRHGDYLYCWTAAVGTASMLKAAARSALV